MSCPPLNRAVFLLLVLFELAAQVPTANSWSFTDGKTQHQEVTVATCMTRSAYLRRVLSNGAVAMASANVILSSRQDEDLAHAAMYDNGPDVNGMTPPTRLPSGTSYQDLRPGTGDATAREGTRVNLQWSLKRGNGYFVDSSERNDGVPFIFTVGDVGGDGAIPGLDEGIRGARLGAIRRIVIPPDLAYVDGVDDDCRGPLPRGFGPRQRIRRVMTLLKDVPGETIVLDVKVTRIQTTNKE